MAIAVLISKFIRTRITVGLALIENYSNSGQSISSDKELPYCLHAINNIPLMSWQNIAWGYIREIPEKYALKDVKIHGEGVFKFNKNEMLI